MDYSVHSSLFQDAHPLVIAGPCSAETRSQVLNTAYYVNQDERIKVFRAGIWKPRARPGTFEGIGLEGLAWLKEVKQNTRLLTCIEVASPEHVEKALEAQIDILWIGARSTANPFTIQALADSLKGVQIPVWVKNPISPDLQLWIGALERFEHCGIKEFALIHRGFSVPNKKNYRNAPMWDLPIEMMRLMPSIPMICDPSHICGNRTMLASIAQKAVDLQMKGLMIEIHPSPDTALSDAQQQIIPTQLTELLNNLIIRTPEVQDTLTEFNLENYRTQIDDVDDQLLQLLAQRLKIVEKVAELKAKENVQILSLPRWDSIVSKLDAFALANSLDSEFLKSLFSHIHQESISLQDTIMNAQPSTQSLTDK